MRRRRFLNLTGAVSVGAYEVDYPFMVMPDHMPRHSGDLAGLRAFAFGYGYIKGILQAVERGS